jgi:Flp pilus assembly protein TadD
MNDISRTYELAVSLFLGGQPGKALEAVEPLLDIRPNDPTLLNLAGACCHGMGRKADAAGWWERAVTVHPGYVEALSNLGCALRELGRLDEAESRLREALAIQPDNAHANSNLCSLLRGQGRFPEAETAVRRALAARPDFVDAKENLGLVLRELGRLTEAESAYRDALSARPHSCVAYNGLALVLQESGRIAEAEQALRRALEVCPDLAGEHAGPGRAHHENIRWILSYMLLLQGKYEEGWRQHEARDAGFQDAKSSSLSAECRQWQGESVQGKSLVVLCEQGFGDSIQFCRYLPLLKGLGLARLTVVCPPALKRLFEGIAGVDAWVLPTDMRDIPRHDFWCFIMSLPLRLGTTLRTIPAVTPYLRAPTGEREHWKAHLPSGGFKVGLVWAGDPGMPKDRSRSMHARALAPLLQIPGVTFVSVQLGAAARSQMEAVDPRWRPLDPMGGVTDFADTAAIVECLDLVISVDTATAHLAGALNRPVWILSRFDGCWRWLIDRDDSPWYPSARLFRQRHRGEWGEVVERVAQALRAHLAQSRGS